MNANMLIIASTANASHQISMTELPPKLIGGKKYSTTPKAQSFVKTKTAVSVAQTDAHSRNSASMETACRLNIPSFAIIIAIHTITTILPTAA